MKLDTKLNSKHLAGGLIVVGLAVVGSYFMLKRYVDGELQEMYNTNIFGSVSAANGPAVPVSAAYDNPPATHAAPRMYVQGGLGSSPNRNPGESWLQGGGASITNSTGRWADVPGSYGGSFMPNGAFMGDSPMAGQDLTGSGYGGA